VPDAEDESEGTLYSSGLIAGASLVGILSAALSFHSDYDPDKGYNTAFALLARLTEKLGGFSDLATAAAIALLAFIIFRAARPPKA